MKSVGYLESKWLPRKEMVIYVLKVSFQYTFLDYFFFFSFLDYICTNMFDPSYPLYRRRQWQPTAVLLPGKSHGWRSLVGCHLWGCTELDTTEAT